MRFEELKNVYIDDWERLTNDRNKWRSLIMERLRETENIFFKKPKKKTKEPEFIFFLHVVYCYY